LSAKGRDFFSSPRPVQLWGPPRLLLNGYRRISPLRVMRPGRDADHSIPSNAETKNACSYTSTPPYVFVASCLIQLRMSSRTSTSFSKGTLPHLTPFPSANNRSLTFSSYITLSFTQFYYLPDRWGWQDVKDLRKIWS